MEDNKRRSDTVTLTLTSDEYSALKTLVARGVTYTTACVDRKTAHDDKVEAFGHEFFYRDR